MTGKFKLIRERLKSFISIICRRETTTSTITRSVAWSHPSSRKLNSFRLMMNLESRPLNNCLKNCTTWGSLIQGKTSRPRKKYQFQPSAAVDLLFCFVPLNTPKPWNSQSLLLSKATFELEPKSSLSQRSLWQSNSKTMSVGSITLQSRRRSLNSTASSMTMTSWTDLCVF